MVIAFESVSVCYDATTVLDRLSFSLSDQAITGIIGASGAGKSTLFHLMSALQLPSQGQIQFFNQYFHPLSSADLKALRRRLGIVFQSYNLLSNRMAWENVCLPLCCDGVSLPLRREAAMKALKQVGLEQQASHYPDQLSGGQKQRVAIARALVREPSILLCDEPTSALDPESTTMILDLLRHLNQRLSIPVVLVTHDMKAVKRICDEVLVLDHGQLVEKGSAQRVYLQPSHLATQRLVREQQDANWQESLHLAKRHAESLYRMIFLGHEVNEPILIELYRHFSVKANVLQADLELVAGKMVGQTICSLDAASEVIEQIREYLQARDILLEAMTDE